eukprot:m.84889 g.84889  ORF g.84889 m.84889 type:complete len:430 (+) comp15037_c0_seq1:137-1426(+)
MQEFQVVVLAGGRGSRLYPLANETPKALLPIGNVPMIAYIMNYLEQAKFDDVILVVQPSDAKAIMRYLLEVANFNIKIDLVSLPEGVDIGTADALRHVKDKIHSDFIVVSSDLVTDLDIHLLADRHRINNASVTCLMSKAAPKTEAELQAEKKLGQDPGLCDFVGLDPKTSQLVLFANQADYSDAEYLPMRRRMLREHPAIDIHTDILDAHFYIFAKWVLAFLAENKRISSIRSELIPLLVRKQFAQPDPKKPGDIYSFVTPQESYNMFAREASPVRCCALVTQPADNVLVARANSIARYSEINRTIPKYLAALLPPNLTADASVKISSASVGQDSIVGEGVTLGDKCTIKKSVIGRNCSIDGKVVNSVVMDNVKIEADCVITNSIVCKSATLSKGVVLTNCQVGKAFAMQHEGTYKNENFVVSSEVDE